MAETSSSYLPLGCYEVASSADPVQVPHQALSEILKTIPQVSERRYSSAFRQLGLAIGLIFLSFGVLSQLPWFLLPAGWAAAGFALTQFDIIGYDCAQDNWTPSTFINRLFGELAMLPLLQSFAVFRTQARSPKTAENETSSSIFSLFYTSLKHLFSPPIDAHSNKDNSSIVLSLSMSHIFLFLTLPTLFYFFGVSGIVKFWLLPLLSYFTLRSYAWGYITNFINARLPASLISNIPSYNFPLLTSKLLKQFPEMDTKFYEYVYGVFKRLDWIHVPILLGTPVLAIYGCMNVPLSTPVLLWSLFYYFMTGIGITAGYHRLWAHKSYEATLPLRFYLLACATGALEGSLKWWAGGHRSHHRYTDTPKDPYSAHGGFWYSHIGWMLVRPDKKHFTKSDIRDLNASAMIRFQHKYYAFVGPFMAFVFPAIVSYVLFNDFYGGFIYAGVTRLVFVHHSTFCVNSVAHYFGEHSYDDERSPRDHIITALLTFGEGYHNFHHEFPNDYRNGIKWYHYDPTKWLIKLWSICGLAYELKQFPENEINMGLLHMSQKKVDELKKKLNVKYPTPETELPSMTKDEFISACEKGKKYTIVYGMVHDIESFIPQHPGGEVFIKMAVGKDSTDHISGATGYYKHSAAARNLLGQYRIASIGKLSARDTADVDLAMEEKKSPLANDDDESPKIRQRISSNAPVQAVA